MIASVTKNNLKIFLQKSHNANFRTIWNRCLGLKHHNKVFIHGRAFSKESAAANRQTEILDERGLLQFDTLHELQTNASIAFRDNPLFGTYTERDGQDPGYEWMSYKEFGEKVASCRAVLKNLGMCYR